MKNNMLLAKIFSIFRNIDWLLLVAVFLLICFGLSTLYSLALGSENKSFSILEKQIISSFLGFILVFIFIIFDYRLWRPVAFWVYGLSFILLFLVLFLGQNIQGTTGWFIFGKLSFQPVEFAKIAVVILLAKFFASRSKLDSQISLWFKSFLTVAPFGMLILLQPDFGSMAVIFFVWLAMLWFYGFNKKYFFIFLFILALTMIISWQFFLQPYQKERILIFLNPQSDLLKSGYNVHQSIVAIGSGGFFGRGLGLGTQSQLHFLPVSEADFIFAALGEEWGFIGASLIFILYFIIFYRLFKIIKNTKDDFGAFLAFGFAMIFFIQLLINVGMAIGVLPVTGLPLPFVSYGGSFLIMSLIMIGMIESIKIRS